MFFQRKEKMNLGSFVRMLSSSLIQKRNVDLSVINKDKILSQEDEARIQEELPYFRIALLTFLLSGTGGKFGSKIFNPQEIGTTVMIGTSLALEDSGLSGEELNNEREKLEKEVLKYLDAIEKIDDKELESKGIFFHLCSAFANLMMNGAKEITKDPTGISRHFIYFDIAKQTYHNNEAAFKTVIKSIKFID